MSTDSGTGLDAGPDVRSDVPADELSDVLSDVPPEAPAGGDGGLVALGLLADGGAADPSAGFARYDVRTLLPLLIGAVGGAVGYLVVLAACVSTLVGRDARTNAGWDWYLVAGAAFSVAAAVVTVRLALRAPLGLRLPFMAATAWLGIVWPLVLAVCLAYFGVRVLRGSAVWKRAGALVCSLAVLGGGVVWGLHAYSGELRRTTLTASDLVGTWRTEGGAHVILAADGTYTASEPVPFLPPAGDASSPPSPGVWDLQDDGDGHSVVAFTPDAVPERGVLAAYSVSARRLLCVDDDGDGGDGCGTAFQRVG